MSNIQKIRKVCDQWMAGEITAEEAIRYVSFTAYEPDEVEGD